MMGLEAELDWKTVTAQYTRDYYEKNVEISNLQTTITTMEQSIVTSSRRGLLRRQLQTASVKVVYTQEISYQTLEEGRNTPETVVVAPFSSPQGRDTYLTLLKEENGDFAEVTTVSKVVQGTGGNEAPVEKPVVNDSGLSTGALVGIIVGCAAGVVAILGIIYFVSQRGDDGGYASSGKTPPSQLHVGNGLHGDEVSTLAEPHVMGRNSGVPNTISGESIVGYGDQR